MWDTSKDYRLRVLEKSVELFIKTAEGANLKGIWNKRKCLTTARAMLPEIQVMYFSYMEPEDLAKSEQITHMKKQVKEITEALGGDHWHLQFLKLVTKDEKVKLQESIAKMKFALNTISTVDKRLSLGPINDPVIGIDIKTGEIVSIQKLDKLFICNITFGDTALTVVTNDLTVKEGNRVGVAILPPSVFMGVTSQGIFLGGENGVLKEVEGNLGEMSRGIPLESLNETRNLVETFLK
ncbi:MAG: tRNA-binding protein [Methanobacterium sp.]|nr:tRNA-binding protein [Methanobacterium sp.]